MSDSRTSEQRALDRAIANEATAGQSAARWVVMGKRGERGHATRRCASKAKRGLGKARRRVGKAACRAYGSDCYLGEQ